MRLLCLHGVGSSGSICEKQFAAFVKAADPSYEFVFVDGPVESARGPGMEAFDQGTFYSHTESYTPSHMAEAIENLEGVIEELGPFDGVVGFSQGAALAVSYLYELQRRGEPSPFGFAMCFSSVLAVSPHEGCCEEAIQRLRTRGLDLTPGAAADTSALTPEERALADVITKVLVPARAHNAMLPDFDVSVYTRAGPDLSEAPRVMVPAVLDQRVHIPTVHVLGKRDADFMQGMATITRGICDEKLMKRLEHDGGHSPPQGATAARAAVAAMELPVAITAGGTETSAQRAARSFGKWLSFTPLIRWHETPGFPP
ncbi:DUF341 domain protein [Durotheca rogersii]|uniref:DUF341 domain protein n=1 Tax=Durotheca rogersii TaxID=419775 RepID=UPI00221F10FB|nr:DUF341 domain protein [Durotheca rogersii]KAI5867873.1 DUF341 domain protein [Durotheca rogersii]